MKYQCDICEAPITVETKTEGDETIMMVRLCSECLDNTYEEGFSDGKDEGYDDGYTDGMEEASE